MTIQIIIGFILSIPIILLNYIENNSVRNTFNLLLISVFIINILFNLNAVLNYTGVFIGIGISLLIYNLTMLKLEQKGRKINDLS